MKRKTFLLILLIGVIASKLFLLFMSLFVLKYSFLHAVISSIFAGYEYILSIKSISGFFEMILMIIIIIFKDLWIIYLFVKKKVYEIKPILILFFFIYANFIMYFLQGNIEVW